MPGPGLEDAVDAYRHVLERCKPENIASRVSLAGRVFRFAVATGRVEHDVAADLKDALAPVASRKFASVTDPMKVGELLRAIDGYSRQPIIGLALKLAPLVFVLWRVAWG